MFIVRNHYCYDENINAYTVMGNFTVTLHHVATLLLLIQDVHELFMKGKHTHRHQVRVTLNSSSLYIFATGPNITRSTLTVSVSPGNNLYSI